MPTKPAAKPRSKAPAHAQPTTADRLKDAVEDLDKARDQAGQQAKEGIDSAIARIREAASELGDRARDQTGEWQSALESAGDDLLRELGRRAVRAQRSPAALKDLSDEIRRRKAELAAEGPGGRRARHAPGCAPAAPAHPMTAPASGPGPVPAEHLLDGDGGHTLRAALAGARIDPVFAERAYRALGLTVPALDEPTLSAEDVAGWSLVRQLLDAGWTEDDVVGVARTAGREARRIAATVVETFLRAPPASERRDAGDDVADLHLALTAGELLPALGPLLGAPVRLHLRELVDEELARRAAPRGGVEPGGEDVVVAFVDAVGFSELCLTLPVRRAGDVAAWLERAATDAVRAPVRLVKLAGDAAMLTGPDAAAVVAAVERMLRAGQPTRRSRPCTRAWPPAGRCAAAGTGSARRSTPPATSRGSRPRARSCVPAGVAAAVPRDDWSPAGALTVRGVDGPLAVSVLAPGSGGLGAATRRQGAGHTARKSSASSAIIGMRGFVRPLASRKASRTRSGIAARYASGSTPASATVRGIPTAASSSSTLANRRWRARGLALAAEARGPMRPGRTSAARRRRRSPGRA